MADSYDLAARDLAARFAETSAALPRQRDALVEQFIGLLGLAGWFPTHIEQRGDETRLMHGGRMRACVELRWPEPFAEDRAVRILAFVNAPGLSFGERR